MKITSIRTYKFSVPAGQGQQDPATREPLYTSSKAWLFLKVETDAGITGWGEGTGEWLAPSVEATLHEWAGLLVGRDPLNVVALTEDITNRLPWKGGPVFGTAIAAINMALYDIAGKAWNVPVHVILGGKRRDKIRVYDNSGLNFSSPDAAAQSARESLALGYRAIKGNPLETRTWPMDHEAVTHSVLCVEAARNEVGPHIDIMLDAHGSPTPELSLEFARRVAKYRPLFIEEPVKVGSTEALLAVSRKSPVPIAVGEKLFEVRDFKQLIDRRACAVLQPDIAHCFGITSMMKIAQLAELNQMLMAPHNVGGPMYHAATVNAAAAMNNFLIQEVTQTFFTAYDQYVEHDWVIRDGYMNVSDRPGLGIEVKEQDLDKRLYEPMPYRQYRHIDGSWKGW